MARPSPADSSEPDAMPPVMHVPCTLLPSPVPRRLYEEAQQLATDFNLLVHNTSRDSEFIFSTLGGVVGADDFTARLLNMHKRVLEEGGPFQSIELGIHRSDYMMDDSGSDLAIKQVEINTIAASFAMLSEITARLHRHVIERWGPPGYDAGRLPPNPTVTELPAAIAAAYDLYVAQRPRSPGSPPAVAVMVVQPGERNVFDQRALEHRLWQQHRVPLLRKTLAELAAARLDEASRALTLPDEAGAEVAVAYFRAGYAPADFPSPREWGARALVERSAAVKCPSLAYHLVGTKKVQQTLAAPGVLERFLPAEAAARVRRCFVGLYGLGAGEADPAVLKRAAERPDEFVLKPQREGGGNNLYGEEVRAALASMGPEQLAAHILMERIRPPAVDAVVLRDGAARPAELTAELGVYSVFVADGGKVVKNGAAGHLLRSKLARQNETGIAAGFGVLDSPYLT